MAKKAVAPDVLVTALSLALQERRRELGLSQDEVAKRAGLHRTYISEVERHSRNFSIKIFMKLAAALETDPSTLMRDAEAMATLDRKPAKRSDNTPRPRAVKI